MKIFELKRVFSLKKIRSMFFCKEYALKSKKRFTRFLQSIFSIYAFSIFLTMVLNFSAGLGR